MFFRYSADCYSCGERVGFGASICPHCGIEDPAPRPGCLAHTLLFFLWLWRRQLYFPAIFVYVLSAIIYGMTETGAILRPLLGFCVFVLLPSALWVLWKVYRTKRSYKRVAVEQMRIYRSLSVSQRRDFERVAEEPHFVCPEEVRRAIEDINTVDRIHFETPSLLFVPIPRR